MTGVMSGTDNSVLVHIGHNLAIDQPAAPDSAIIITRNEILVLPAFIRFDPYAHEVAHQNKVQHHQMTSLLNTLAPCHVLQ